MCPLAAVMDNISEQMSFYSPKGQINKNNKTIRRVRSRCHCVCICSVNHLPPVKTLISLITGAPALTRQCLCAETEAEDIMNMNIHNLIWMLCTCVTYIVIFLHKSLTWLNRTTQKSKKETNKLSWTLPQRVKEMDRRVGMFCTLPLGSCGSAGSFCLCLWRQRTECILCSGTATHTEEERMSTSSWQEKQMF